MKIQNRALHIYSDAEKIYPFLTEIYTPDWRNGVSAPFFEYALYSTWSDKSYGYLNRLWLDGEKIVGFVFHESAPFEWNFSLRPGYEALSAEMISYVKEQVPSFASHPKRLLLWQGQTSLIQAAGKLGYTKQEEYTDFIYDFQTQKPLDYPLPQGFRIVPAGETVAEKVAECCWKGFDHETEKGAWKVDNSSYIPDQVWTPANQLKCVRSLAAAPHSTPELDVNIENEKGEYVCHAGMWWVPENRLAYLEPLCTAPEYRKRGLAAAALSELYRRTKALGATHMTGGGVGFYQRIGYNIPYVSTLWELDPRDNL